MVRYSIYNSRENVANMARLAILQGIVRVVARGNLLNITGAIRSFPRPIGNIHCGNRVSQLFLLYFHQGINLLKCQITGLN